MRIAVLSPYVPYAGIDHAGGQFLLHWVRSLAERGSAVTVIAPNQAGVDLPRGVANGESFEVLEVPLRDSPSVRRWGTRLTTTFLTPGWGVTRAFAGDPSVAATVAAAELVEIQWSQFLPVMRAVRQHGKPMVAIAHDVISESARRRLLGARVIRERMLAAARWPTYRWTESRLLNRCSGVLTFSERDATLLVARGIRPSIRTISPWIEPVILPPGPAGNPVVLMVGQFGRAENADGAHWFLERCWPRVRAAIPDARLVLAGAAPPSTFTGEAVTVTGWVEELDTWYRQAAVVIAPLLSGGGLKFKVAQAMKYALPVVATPIAADGYREAGGQDAFVRITSDPHQFADAVAASLSDTAGARAVGRRGAAWASRMFDWDRSVDDTLTWYRTLVGSPA